MQLFVGLSAHRGSIKRYPFDILELPVSPSLPKPKTLKEMREARPDVAFSLRLLPEVATVGASHPDVERAKIARDCLGAQVVVIATGPRFTPTPRNQELLQAMVDALKSETTQVAWEPRGVFSQREAEKWAASIGALLVRDLTREPGSGGSVIYTRLLGLGFGARVSQHAAETLAEQLSGAERAFVIVGGEGVKNLRNQLRSWLGTGEDDEEDEDFELGADDEAFEDEEAE